MSPLRHHDRLNAIAADIHELLTSVLDLERSAGDLSSDDASAVAAGAAAFMARAKLEALLLEYFQLAEVERDRTCPIHDLGFVTACLDCRRISERQRCATRGDARRGESSPGSALHATPRAQPGDSSSCRVAPSTTISIHGHERHVPLLPVKP